MFNLDLYNNIEEVARLCTRGFEGVKHRLNVQGGLLSQEIADRRKLGTKLEVVVEEVKALRGRVSDLELVIDHSLQAAENGQAPGTLRYDEPTVGFPYGARVLNISMDRLYRKLSGLPYARQNHAQLDKLDGMRAGVVIPRPAGTFAFVPHRVYVLCDDGKVRVTRPDQLKVIG